MAGEGGAVLLVLVLVVLVVVVVVVVVVEVIRSSRWSSRFDSKSLIGGGGSTRPKNHFAARSALLRKSHLEGPDLGYCVATVSHIITRSFSKPWALWDTGDAQGFCSY